MEQYKSKYTSQEIEEKLTNGESAESLLNKLKEVDGTGSELDADTVDGFHVKSFPIISDVIRFKIDGYDGKVQKITTEQFIQKLVNLGVFTKKYWICRCEWSYAQNDIIIDTGCGDIQLAGCIIEVINGTTSISGTTAIYTIRIITSPAVTKSLETNPVANAIFIYRYNGNNYTPNWQRLANISETINSANKLITKQLTNEDLNTIKDVNFTNYNGIGENTCINKPEGVKGFNLTCYKTADGASFVQELTTHNIISYKRQYWAGQWSSWKKILTEDDLTNIIQRLDNIESKI